jgi:hypothetical protein
MKEIMRVCVCDDVLDMEKIVTCSVKSDAMQLDRGTVSLVFVTQVAGQAHL